MSAPISNALRVPWDFMSWCAPVSISGFLCFTGFHSARQRLQARYVLAHQCTRRAAKCGAQPAHEAQLLSSIQFGKCEASVELAFAAPPKNFAREVFSNLTFLRGHESVQALGAIRVGPARQAVEPHNHSKDRLRDLLSVFFLSDASWRELF